MTLKNTLIAVTAVYSLTVALAAPARSFDALHVSTGFVSHILCSAAFVQGLDPDQAYTELRDAMPGSGLVSWGLDYTVDRTRKEVVATLFGGGESRAAYRGGLGCVMIQEGERIEQLPLLNGSEDNSALLPDIAGPATVAASSPRLARALDDAFAETGSACRHTKAIIVVRNGRIIAERYAAGYGPETLLHGYSATKSMTNALIGILVRQGKLEVDKPAPLALWQKPGDPHQAITVDHLLRHTSGLAMGSSLQASIASALDPVNRMKYLKSDMAAYAARSEIEAKPGELWNYHDGNTILLSRLIRDAAGGQASDVMRFARRELFAPLGMQSVVLEFDATGTPDGSTQMIATARDWARFGLLYLNDGMAGGRRILPEGWVRYSATPTPGAWLGYGAGFWANAGDSHGANFRKEHGWPADAFYASGTFGQYVIVLPSENLVIVRFGTSGDRGDIEGVSKLVTEVVAAQR